MQTSAEYHRPKVIAHRGASGIAPENTLSAVRLALEASVDMIEIDVHLSKDKKVIVLHDATVERTTEGFGAVAEKELSELQQLDAGSWFGPEFTGESIPTLSEVLQLIEGKCTLLIELKKGLEGRYEGLEAAVLAEVDRANARPWVIMQSFEYETVQEIQRLAPAMEVHQLITVARGIDRFEGISAINPYYRTLTRSFIRSAHEKNLKVFTYTVNSPREMRKCIRGGVDGIITNFPDRLLAVIQEWEEK